MFNHPKLQKLVTPILLGIGLTMAGEFPASSAPYRGHNNHGHGNVHHQQPNYHREVFKNRGHRRSLNVRPRRALPIKSPHHGNVHHKPRHGHGNVHHQGSGHNVNHNDYYYDRYGNRRRRRFNSGNSGHRNVHHGKNHGRRSRRSRPAIQIRFLR